MGKIYNYLRDLPHQVWMENKTEAEAYLHSRGGHPPSYVLSELSVWKNTSSGPQEEFRKYAYEMFEAGIPKKIANIRNEIEPTIFDVFLENKCNEVIQFSKDNNIDLENNYIKIKEDVILEDAIESIYELQSKVWTLYYLFRASEKFELEIKLDEQQLNWFNLAKSGEKIIPHLGKALKTREKEFEANSEEKEIKDKHKIQKNKSSVVTSTTIIISILFFVFNYFISADFSAILLIIGLILGPLIVGVTLSVSCAGPTQDYNKGAGFTAAAIFAVLCIVFLKSDRLDEARMKPKSVMEDPEVKNWMRKNMKKEGDTYYYTPNK